MTSELVANVVRHTESQVTVTVRPGPPVRVEVHDGIAATDTFRRLVSTAGRMPEASSPGGRGLALVRELASKIGLDDDPDGGKVVWFEL
jgi:anti-sigma regulatory factor (Ser/Thr protein kinase)